MLITEFDKFNMWPILILFLLSLLLIAFADSIFDKFIHVAHMMKSKKIKSIPGPRWKWPIIGHRRIVRSRGGLGKASMSLADELDTDLVGLYLCGKFAVVTCSSQATKEVFTRSEFLGRPKNFFLYLRSMKTNKGITMTDGPLWQEQRSFLVKQLSEFGFGKEAMNVMIDDSLKSILKALGEGGPQVDLSSFISKSVINIIWRFVTGKEIPDDKLTELVRLMMARSRAFDSSGGLLGQMPWLRYLFPEWTGYNLIMKLNSQVKNLIQETIYEHKATYTEGVTRDFIDSYLQKMYEPKANSTFTDDQLMMVCLDLFIGGIMTTSTSLDFCFLRMVHHQDVQAKAQAELDSILGNKLPTVVDRQRLPYMRAVINECLRMTITVPVSGPRRALKSTTIGNYIIPKDTTIYMNMIQFSMDKAKFPEPDLFKPERFLDINDNEDESSSANHSCPFGFGKRRCPGEVLARSYIFTILAGLLHQYNFGPPHRRPVPSLEPNVGITHSPKPYKLSIAKRVRIKSTVF